MKRVLAILFWAVVLWGCKKQQEMKCYECTVYLSATSTITYTNVCTTKADTLHFEDYYGVPLTFRCKGK